MQYKPENTPMIETERLLLRKFTEDDLTDFFRILSDEEVNKFLPWFTVKTLEEAKGFLEKNYFEYYKRPSAYRYAICLKTNNKPVGYVVVGNKDSYDFGYGLKKEFWHRGIVTEAAKAVVRQFKNAGYTYLTATHDVNNPRSGEVMKKLGMTYQYSYVEQWQPKNIAVTFRMYQLNFDGNNERVYMEYWNKYANHFIEQGL